MLNSTVTVNIQGASIHKRGERFQVRLPGGKIHSEIPIFRINNMWLFGSINLSNEVLKYSLTNGPWIHFLTLKGLWRGAVGPLLSHRSVVRIKQYRFSSSKKRSLIIAKNIIKLKLNIQNDLMKKWCRRKKNNINKLLILMHAAIDSIDTAKSSLELLGIEGTAAKLYFSAYSQMFIKNIKFTERSRRPPKDPANALLSLGYTFLLSEILSSISLVGLDPWIGFFHKPKSKKASLVLDLMEPFRMAIDEMVLKAINLAMFTLEDFRDIENNGVHLKKEQFSKFAKLFGKMLEEPLKYSEDSESSMKKQINKFVLEFKNSLYTKQDASEIKFKI